MPICWQGRTKKISYEVISVSIHGGRLVVVVHDRLR